MKHKNAGSKGAYIDRLRVKYPFRICRESEPEYTAVLVGVQPLLGVRKSRFIDSMVAIVAKTHLGMG